ncbi:MAG TPA: hypothetical protein VM491_01895, partial [Burkholderiaceae bacterium]|nr:hypothetical protein [Burkholderiaceae bacterium]
VRKRQSSGEIFTGDIARCGWNRCALARGALRPPPSGLHPPFVGNRRPRASRRPEDGAWHATCDHAADFAHAESITRIGAGEAVGRSIRNCRGSGAAFCLERARARAGR